MNKLTLSLLSLLFIAAACYGQPVQLAPPLLQYHSVFFKNFTTVTLQFRQDGTKINYTLNGKQPTEKDNIYNKPIQIKNSITTLKAITSGKGFLNSAAVAATFIKEGLKIKSIQQTPANKRFPGNGVNALIDNEGGSTNLNSSTWLGYQKDSVEINIQTGRKQNISSVLIHYLQDHGSWIFLPEHIQVFYFDEGSHSFRLIAEQLHPAKEIIEGASCIPLLITLSKKVNTQKIKIILKPVSSLPKGHTGNGEPGWLFIDEIKLY
jgi:hexosaminidase